MSNEDIETLINYDVSFHTPSAPAVKLVTLGQGQHAGGQVVLTFSKIEESNQLAINVEIATDMDPEMLAATLELAASGVREKVDEKSSG